jgi:hypothetical protein
VNACIRICLMQGGEKVTMIRGMVISLHTFLLFLLKNFDEQAVDTTMFIQKLTK